LVDAHDTAELAPCVASLFPEGVTAAHVHGSVSPSHLFTHERTYVQTAVIKRQSEFSAGRVCARLALATIGLIDAPLLVAEDRLPLWPTGTTGSISHTDGYCVAAVGLARRFCGIGVDTETLGRVEPKLWQEIFRVEEINRLHILNELQQLEIATVMFSAKEAFYKCQFTLTRRWLEFKDVSVEIAANTFRIQICRDKVESPLLPRLLYGKFFVDGTRVVCGIAIQP